ncbi:hypothetical protein ACIQZO_10505 [Streptomyces sp. NPDC097617]|uniref:hypothetical protein n=1 Tax=Streptomyces sp. NPDC097617 TaxID=3366091 RepID=UPI0038175D17
MARTQPRLVLLAAATTLVTGAVSLSAGAFAARAAPAAPRVGSAAVAAAGGDGVRVRGDLPKMPRWEVTRVFEVRCRV